MQKIIDKFVMYLEIENTNTQVEIIKHAVKENRVSLNEKDNYFISEIYERDNISRILKLPKSEWTKVAELFVEFDVLSKFLLPAPLSNEEKIKIVFYLIEKNIAAGVLDMNRNAFDTRAVDKYDFKYFAEGEFMDFVRSEAYYELLNKKESEMTEEEKLKINEFNEFTSKNPLDISHIIDKHKKVKEHYFDKVPTLTEDDIQKVVEVLSEFGLDSSLCQRTKKYLKNNYYKMPVHTVVKQKVKPVDMKVYKEQKLLERELNGYFNLDDMKVNKELTMQEQVYSVALMKRLGIDETKIKEVLRIMNKPRNNRVQHPMEQYLYLVEKLSFYATDYDFIDELKEVEECFINSWLANPEERDYYNDYAALLLSEIMDKIPDGYLYELEKGEALVKAPKPC